MKKLIVLIIAAVLVLTVSAVSAKGITIAVPNDATNEGRALLLLEAYGLMWITASSTVTTHLPLSWMQLSFMKTLNPRT